jgi:hypothetical protein
MMLIDGAAGGSPSRPDEMKSRAYALASLEFDPEELERRERPAEISYRCHTVRDIEGQRYVGST